MASNIALQQTKSGSVQALAASTASIIEIPVTQDIRIKRYWAVSSVAQVAHATATLDATFVNAGLDGSGTTELAVVTNDSDLADTTTRKSSAWVAHDLKEVNAEARPVSADATNVADYVAAGSVIKITVTKGAGATTGNVEVGFDFVPST